MLSDKCLSNRINSRDLNCKFHYYFNHIVYLAEVKG